MFIDLVKYITIKPFLESYKMAVVDRPHSEIYEKVYGEWNYPRIFMPRKFNDRFGLKDRKMKIPLLELESIDVLEMEKNVETHNFDKIKPQIRKIGKDYVLSIVPQLILPKKMDKGYRISMDFVSLLLGASEETEISKKGFAYYRYDKDYYPFGNYYLPGRGTIGEKAVWAFMQGAATIIHNEGNEDGPVEMFAHVFDNEEENKVCIESRDIYDWETIIKNCDFKLADLL